MRRIPLLSRILVHYQNQISTKYTVVVVVVVVLSVQDSMGIDERRGGWAQGAMEI